MPPVYPNGWICVGESLSLKPGQVQSSIICGNEIALFRKKNGEISCLDAFCPHLGAHLGEGGIVETREGENCLKCPFHGWSFSPNGLCVHVPYTENKSKPTTCKKKKKKK